MLDLPRLEWLLESVAPNQGRPAMSGHSIKRGVGVSVQKGLVAFNVCEVGEAMPGREG